MFMPLTKYITFIIPTSLWNEKEEQCTDAQPGDAMGFVLEVMFVTICQH